MDLIDTSGMGYPVFTTECAVGVNDGYWVKNAPCATIFAYFCPYKYAFEFMNAYREVFKRRWNESILHGKRNRFNQMAEFRIVTIHANGPILFNLPPGTYIVSEVLTLNGYLQDEVDEAFAEMETKWSTIPYTGGAGGADLPTALIKPAAGADPAYVRVFPHVCKNWAYGSPGGIPWSDSGESEGLRYTPFHENLMKLGNFNLAGSDPVVAVAGIAADIKTEAEKGPFWTAQSNWLVAD